MTDPAPITTSVYDTLKQCASHPEWWAPPGWCPRCRMSGPDVWQEQLYGAEAAKMFPPTPTPITTPEEALELLAAYAAGGESAPPAAGAHAASARQQIASLVLLTQFQSKDCYRMRDAVLAILDRHAPAASEQHERVGDAARCATHHGMPQMNTAANGAECGICVRDMTRIADAVHRATARAHRNGYCDADEEMEHEWAYEGEEGAPSEEQRPTDDTRTCSRCGYEECCDEGSWGPV